MTIMLEAATLCYVYVMPIRRITISVPDALADKIKDAAGDTPVSQWVADLIERKLNEEDELEEQWNKFVKALPPDPESEARAAEMFDRLVLGRERRDEK
jgi:hypothetical protein